MPESRKRIVIVGGVAGGASCAARARRLCEQCEIVVFDRGPHVSFANCGLPYYVGDVIPDERHLLVATPELFERRFNIRVHPLHEVVAIDRRARRVRVRDLQRGSERDERYDALVLATGARPVRPPIPGIDLPGVHVVRTIPDTRRIREAIAGARRALVVGGGFIGLEMAENLVRRGLEVSVIELAPQVLPPLDPEMAAYVAAHLRSHGVALRLGAALEELRPEPAGGLVARTSTGEEISADLVILSIGVRPETTLAEQCGLELGDRGGVRVDGEMRTSDPHIWAVGDCVEVRDVVTGAWQVVPLAGPANRQGRIAAASILGRTRPPGAPPIRFRGVQATAVCGVFGLTVAMTGCSEKALRKAGELEFRRIYLHPGNHASYFPGATPIHMKLLFAPGDGRVLGAQAVGESGVERRIDIVAAAIQKGASVFDLEEAELCYAPQFGAAKDPVNVAGMIAANHLRGELPLADWSELGAGGATILDVRSPAEYQAEHIPGAVNIPLEQLRERLDEVPRNGGPVWTVCAVGQRAYYATRLLLQRGIPAALLSGGMRTYQSLREAGLLPAGAESDAGPGS